MKKGLWGLIGLALIIGFLFVGCDNGTTNNDDFQNGIYDGIGVWLVDQTNMTTWQNNSFNGQPKPTAIGHLTGKIEDLSENFSVLLKEPHDFSPSDQGWWNINQNGTDWTPPGSDDYYVLLIPMWWPSGISGKGEMLWDFDIGKISAAGVSPNTISVTGNNPSFSLLAFQNMNEVGIYDGIGVWLVSETNMAKWKSGKQPTPTAIGFVDGKIEDLSATFSVQLKEPYDYGNGQKFWSAKEPDENWTPVNGNYYVFLVPMWWFSGIKGTGNFNWFFDEGKASAAGFNSPETLTISDGTPTFYLADFKDFLDTIQL